MLQLFYSSFTFSTMFSFRFVFVSVFVKPKSIWRGCGGYSSKRDARRQTREMLVNQRSADIHSTALSSSRYSQRH